MRAPNGSPLRSAPLLGAPPFRVIVLDSRNPGGGSQLSLSEEEEEEVDLGGRSGMAQHQERGSSRASRRNGHSRPGVRRTWVPTDVRRTISISCLANIRLGGTNVSVHIRALGTHFGTTSRTTLAPDFRANPP